MAHDSNSIERLQALESQLAQLQQERDQLKQRIEAEQIQAVQSVQPLLEKINDRLKLHGFIVGIDDELIIYLAHQRDINDRRTLLDANVDQLEKALNIIERHIDFITAVTSSFSIYKDVSAFAIHLDTQQLAFRIFSDSYSVRFTYDSASDTVSAYAYAARSRMNMSFVFGDVTMVVDADNSANVNYTLKTQTYTETLKQVPALYAQVKSSMLAVLSKLSI